MRLGREVEKGGIWLLDVFRTTDLTLIPYSCISFAFGHVRKYQKRVCVTSLKHVFALWTGIKQYHILVGTTNSDLRILK
jgi:hypothetical protein